MLRSPAKTEVYKLMSLRFGAVSFGKESLQYPCQTMLLESSRTNEQHYLVIMFCGTFFPPSPPASPGARAVVACLGALLPHFDGFFSFCFTSIRLRPFGSLILSGWEGKTYVALTVGMHTVADKVSD